jgi:hypothetical protein
MGAWTFFLRKGVTVVVPECHLHSQDRLVNSWQNGCKSAGSPSGKPYAALKKRSLDSNTSQDLFDFTATNSDTRNLAILMIISLITSSTKFQRYRRADFKESNHHKIKNPANPYPILLISILMV